MTPFLVQFHAAVDDWLRDPNTSRRLTPEKRMQDLHSVQGLLFQKYARASGLESQVGRTTCDLTIKAGQEYYALPPAFVNFLSLKRYDTTDPRIVIAELNTIPLYDQSPGIEILSDMRGIRVQPVPPSGTADEVWTLEYIKGPIRLHYAKAKSVGPDSITLGTPPNAEAGEIVKLDNYYAGSIVNVYSADMGCPQAREIVASSARTGGCKIRPGWAPTPEGDVWYEIIPEIPDRFWMIYPIRVAMMNAAKRISPERRNEMRGEFEDLFNEVRRHFASKTKDRPPTRIPNPKRFLEDGDPYEGQYADFSM